MLGRHVYGQRVVSHRKILLPLKYTLRLHMGDFSKYFFCRNGLQYGGKVQIIQLLLRYDALRSYSSALRRSWFHGKDPYSMEDVLVVMLEHVRNTE